MRNTEEKKLRKINEQEEKLLFQENKDVYTDIIVYLSGKISGYEREQVRNDIIHIILDGQNRNDTIDHIISSDPKAFCDSILENYADQKVSIMKDYVFPWLSSLLLLAFITCCVKKEFIQSVKDVIAYKPLTDSIPVYISDIMVLIMVPIFAILFIELFIKKVFDFNSNKYLSPAFILSIIGVTTGLLLIVAFLRIPVFYTSLYYCVGFIFSVFAAYLFVRHW